MAKAPMTYPKVGTLTPVPQPKGPPTPTNVHRLINGLSYDVMSDGSFRYNPNLTPPDDVLMQHGVSAAQRASRTSAMGQLAIRANAAQYTNQLLDEMSAASHRLGFTEPIQGTLFGMTMPDDPDPHEHNPIMKGVGDLINVAKGTAGALATRAGLRPSQAETDFKLLNSAELQLQKFMPVPKGAVVEYQGAGTSVPKGTNTDAVNQLFINNIRKENNDYLQKYKDAVLGRPDMSIFTDPKLQEGSPSAAPGATYPAPQPQSSVAPLTAAPAQPTGPAPGALAQAAPVPNILQTLRAIGAQNGQAPTA